MAKPPLIKHFRPFIVCDDEKFAACRAFYLDLGFQILWESDDVVEFTTGYGEQRFLLTLHYGLRPARLAVFQFWVEDVDEWHEHVKSLDLARRHPGSRFAEPTVTEWGWRMLYVWDPFGTLLHIGKPHTEQAESEKS